MSDGLYTDGAGRSWQYDIIEIHTFDGEVLTGSEWEDNLDEADRVFYSVTSDDGETFYRFVGGPFNELSDVYEAIEDDGDFYSDSS